MKRKTSIPTMIIVLIFSIYLITGTFSVFGDVENLNWPRWRGPNGDGISTQTGKKVWDSDKPPKNIRAIQVTTGTDYATPVIYDYGGKRYAVISSYEGIHSVDVETGKVIWLYEWELYSGCQIADPLIFNNKVFITQYLEKLGCVLLDIGGEKPKVLWKNLNMHSKRPPAKQVAFSKPKGF